MGGPAAGVLLHQVPEDHQILDLRTWLGANADFYDASENADLLEGWEFSLHWPTSLGEEPPDRPCLAGLQMYLIDPEAEYSGESYLSPAAWVRYSQALGWMPACELSVWSGCSQPRDNKILGWLCAELATRFNGMIDLGGMLPIPKPCEWSRVGLTGRVVEVAYNTDADRLADIHLVDSDFLRTWMLQPQFHMIK